jgi:hypothetical protein
VSLDLKNVCVCVCGVFCPFSHLCSQRTLFVCLSALASQEPLTCPHRHLSFAQGYVFDFLEHIHRVCYALFGLCVCFDDMLDLQHTQHDAHSYSIRPDGRVARNLSHIIDPKECVCGVCFGWFYR